MTRRTETHIIDTLAVRQIISALPSNWLVRSLEERDYGIDLSIELYNGEHPTGCFSLIQIKGKKNSFSNDEITLGGFPTKTLEYATLFPEPFFIFHNSIEDKKTYFVWAQKYIEIRLSKDNPNWIDQDSNTIKFPIDNLLGSEDGNAKIERIMRKLSANKSGLEFLAEYEWLKIHWENCKFGETDVILNCIDIVKKLKKHTIFYSVYHSVMNNINLNDLLNRLEFLKTNPIKDSFNLDENEAKELSEIDSHINNLESLKMLFLSQRDMDEFEEDFSSTSPY